MELVLSNDWVLNTNIKGEQAIRLSLLDDDIRSAQLAYNDFDQSYRKTLNGGNKLQQKRVFHHAKNFICAMRRVGRLLEALSSNRSIFQTPTSDVIKLVWRKKKSMFDTYIDPRNAIEHIDGEIKGRTTWIMMNLHDKELAVTEETKAQISKKNLNSAIEARNEIVDSILNNIDNTAT